MKSKSTIRKGTIVWYWHEKEKAWLKGKVISANRYFGPPRSNTWPGLWVMERKTKKPYWVHWSNTAYPASEPKPFMEPIGYRQWKAMANRWSFYNNHIDRTKAKLYLKLGIVPK